MRVFRPTLVYVFVLMAVSMAPGVSTAQQSNFSITPPPIASPTFIEGDSEMKFRGTIVSISGPDISLSGAGADMVLRKAFSNEFAGDLQFGVFGIGGDIGSGIYQESVTMSMFQMAANLELQPFKTDTLNMIIFTGLTLSASLMSGDSFDATTSLAGIQVGMQLGLKAGDFHIDPFFMTTSQSGSATTSTSMGDYTADIPAFTTTSVGLDIVYIPANLTLSSIIQQAAEQDTNSDYDVTIFQVAWSTKF